MRLATVENRERERAEALDTKERRAREAERVSEQAALELRRSAARSDRGLELDYRALTSTKMLRSRARFFGLCWWTSKEEALTVYVERAKLRELRKALKPFGRSVEAYLSAGQPALHIRWRGGRGGLNLSQRLERRPRQREATVHWISFLVEVQ
jgi:hypothetical protein